MVMALDKAGKILFRAPSFPALPSAVTMALDNGSFAECNTRQSDPKRQFLILFYIP